MELSRNLTSNFKFLYIALFSTGATAVSCSIMAKLSRSFLMLEKEDTCLLCKSCFQRGETVNHFTQKGWPGLIKNALKWKDIALPSDHEFFLFTTVHDSLDGVEKAFGKAHEKCRITLSTKSSQYRKRFNDLHQDEKKAPVVKQIIDEDEKPKVSRSTRLSNPVPKGICFICNEERECDQQPYNTGGLTKLSEENDAFEKLSTRTSEFIKNSNHTYHRAASRFSAACAKVHYHQSCYIR